MTFKDWLRMISIGLRFACLGFVLWFLFGPMLFFALCAVGCVVFILKNKEYKASSYYQVTRLPYLLMQFDAGRYGEYMTYVALKQFEALGAKFLFNVYIPKSDGGTTEIDVLMICSHGVFVFESKNFSGWIFGDERHKNWCQTLRGHRGKSRKEYFYNPIWQNQGHIKHLRALIGDYAPHYSVVVFSNRCTLQDVNVESREVCVIQRCDVCNTVSLLCSSNTHNSLTSVDVQSLYAKLYPYSQVSAAEKKQHVDDIYR